MDCILTRPRLSDSGNEDEIEAAVRSGEYKLIQFYDPEKVELYHLKEDVGEQNDLSEKLPEKKKELLDKLNSWLENSNIIRHKINPEYQM